MIRELTKPGVEDGGTEESKTSSAYYYAAFHYERTVVICLLGNDNIFNVNINATMIVVHCYAHRDILI